MSSGLIAGRSAAGRAGNRRRHREFARPSKSWYLPAPMGLHQFDLNLLRALDALLSERNVTRAAEKLFVTQQAMSGSLHRLREHFGDELLTRVGRKMELTPLARSLQKPVREGLLHVHSALETRPTFDPAAARRTFRVAMSDYASVTLMPRVMRKLASEAPHMTCHVETLNETSFDRLDDGDLDFHLSAGDCRLYGDHPPGAEISSIPLFRDDFVCVVDRRNALVGAEMTLDLYQRLPHNVVRMGAGLKTIVEQGWLDAQLKLRIVSTAPTFTALIFMVPGTPLVATAQRRLATALAPALNLRVLECPVRFDFLQENLAWHPRNEGDPCFEYVRQVFRDAAGELDRTVSSPKRARVAALANHKR